MRCAVNKIQINTVQPLHHTPLASVLLYSHLGLDPPSFFTIFYQQFVFTSLFSPAWHLPLKTYPPSKGLTSYVIFLISTFNAFTHIEFQNKKHIYTQRNRGKVGALCFVLSGVIKEKVYLKEFLWSSNGGLSSGGHVRQVVFLLFQKLLFSRL